MFYYLILKPVNTFKKILITINAFKKIAYTVSLFLIISLCFSLLFISCNNSNPGNTQKEKNEISQNSKEHKLSPEKISQEYSLEELDNSAGLSNSSVNCIFQDSQNLIWIGTWDGLNRYDGNSFKTYRPEPGNENSISNQVVLKIVEDKEGKIWVLTMHGINCYDKKTDTFSHYYFSADTSTPLSESHFNLALNADKEVFCSVKDWGLGYFDGKIFQHLNISVLKGKTILRLQFLNNEKLLALTEDNDLYTINIKKSGKNKTVSNSVKINSGIRTFNTLPDNGICIVNTSGVSTILKASGDKIPVSKETENIIGHTDKEIILSEKSEYLITDFSGNIKNTKWAALLSKYKITSITKGTEGLIWIGTDGDGIVKIALHEKSFNNISKASIPEIDGGIVRSFLKSNNNSIWIGTKGKGLFHIKSNLYPTAKTPLSYSYFNENNSMINNAVYVISKARDNIILIGTDDKGITIYDEKESKLVYWKDIVDSDKCGYFKSVYAIYQDLDNNIWLGTNGYGMIKLKMERDGKKLKITDHKKYIASNAQPNTLSSNIIFSIVPKDNNKIWVGTRLGGLNLFDKTTDGFTSFKNNSYDKSLSSNDILCLAVDAKNTLWIGTSYGLNRLDSLTDNNKAFFTHYTVNNGLPNNTVHGIIPDENSSLWISTNFGLSNFNISEGKFTNYVKNDGLQNNEFADGAFYRDSESGYIFMGGIKGFNYFLPKNITQSNDLPDLFIDKISGHNQSVPYYQGLLVSPDINTPPSITLKHNQNFFDIHLTALTYINNEKCTYAYQLEGFDKGWNTIDNRKLISFTNVPPGNYSLWMKWSNSDGVWTDPVHTINIKVKPVWWQSNTALIIYFLLALCFILFVRSYYLKRQSLKQNILFRQKEEELHENRLTFFTNIAHEFLTPLTLISGPAQKLSETNNLDDRNKKFVNMIKRNASRLSFLTQQLLEFRKAEHDHLDVKVREFDLVNIMEQIAELFDDWAIDKNIDYTLNIPHTMKGWFDKEKIEKIIFNLLSNAFKYTPANGKINLECLIEDSPDKKLKIAVTNNGKGIPKEKLESIFDRFFLSDPNQVSDTEMFRTGIGLAYVKRLVSVLRGEITVSSIPDENTVFTVIIPCEKEFFMETELDSGITSFLISHQLKDILEETLPEQENIPEKIIAIDKAESHKKKILIAEDEKEIHTYLKDLLSNKYELIFALNGNEALKIMETKTPDIIISDVMMPVMDGVEFCRTVKTDVRTCHIPLIMLTAKSSVEHRIEGLESGANSYIPKPFYPDHLLVRIQKLLEEKELILKHFAQDTLVDNLPEIPINNDEKTFIKTVIDLIRENIDNEKLDSAFIEKEMGISNSQLYRKAKEIFNLSPGDLIRTIRLKYAAELLRKNILTVSEVCYKSGFNNRSYFYREFKKIYKTTPKNYQLQFKNKAAAF